MSSLEHKRMNGATVFRFAVVGFLLTEIHALLLPSSSFLPRNGQIIDPYKLRVGVTGSVNIHNQTTGIQQEGKKVSTRARHLVAETFLRDDPPSYMYYFSNIYRLPLLLLLLVESRAKKFSHGRNERKCRGDVTFHSYRR